MFGARRSHPAKLGRRISLASHPAVAATLAALPGEADLADHQPPIMAQGGSDACEGHGGSAVLYTAFAAAGRPLGFVPSPWALWTPPRARERSLSTAPGAAVPKLTNTGVQTADLVSGFGEFGVVPMGSVQPMAPDGRFSDVDPARVEDEIDLGALVAGAMRPIVGAYGIDPTAANASDMLAAAIASGIPALIAFYADDAFEQASATTVVGAPVEIPGVDRGHCCYVPAFRTVNGKRQFRVCNSWGGSWAASGQVWVDESFIHSMWEAWPVAVASS